jgi:hypothetical protein
MDRRDNRVWRKDQRRGVSPNDLALEQLVRTWLEYLPVIVPVASAFESAPADDAGRKAWDERMSELREGFRFVISRLEEAGLLNRCARHMLDLRGRWRTETSPELLGRDSPTLRRFREALQ